MCQVDVAVGERDDFEVFYSCPTLTAPAFLAAAGQLAAQLAGPGVSASSALDNLAQLSTAVLVSRAVMPKVLCCIM